MKKYISELIKGFQYFNLNHNSFHNKEKIISFLENFTEKMAEINCFLDEIEKENKNDKIDINITDTLRSYNIYPLACEYKVKRSDSYGEILSYHDYILEHFERLLLSYIKCGYDLKFNKIRFIIIEKNIKF